MNTFTWMAESHGFNMDYPKCTHMEIHAYNQYEHNFKLPVGDPKLKTLDKERYSIMEVTSGFHTFDENGYLSCIVCRWTP